MAKVVPVLIAHIAGFLWPERDIEGGSSPFRMVSVACTRSLRLIWVLSVGDTPPSQSDVWDPWTKPSPGLWIHTNKDMFCLIDAAAMSPGKAHQVVAAVNTTCRERFWIAVWVDGKLCPEHARLRPAEFSKGLLAGGQDARAYIEWCGGRGEVQDISIHEGELVNGVDPDDILHV